MRHLWLPTLLFSLLATNCLAQITPVANPDLALKCPYNIIFILDESGSIVNSTGNADNISSELRNGARDLINALQGTGSRVAVMEFNSNARRVPVGGSTNYQTVDAGYAAAFNSYISRDNNQNPSDLNYDPEDYSCPNNQCYTNWEAAFNEVLNMIATDGFAELVIFFTDGVPTAYINTSGGVTLGTNQATQQQALLEAMRPANVVKSGGTHIFVVGLPNPNLPEANVQAISGPDKYPSPQGDFSKGDYTVSTSQTLQQDLGDIANQFPAPTSLFVSVNLCEGQSYFAGGALQTQSGTYYDTFFLGYGCDSLVITELQAGVPFADTVAVTLCDNEFYFAGGALQNTNGTYRDSFTSASGCDSLLTTQISILPLKRKVWRTLICSGDSLYAGGDFRTQSGTYYDTLDAAIGCDTVQTTFLSITTCDDRDACTQDYCSSGFCSHVELNCTATIAGAILTEIGVPVPGVIVTLSGSDNQIFVTGADGHYSFLVATGGSYTITPTKMNDVSITNGITTLDFHLIRQHVLGGQLLGSPYKIIAADANLSSSVTTLDVNIVRSLVLMGNGSNFPHSGLWQFVSSDFLFADPAHPFPFEKSRNYSSASGNSTNQNFIAVKMCDVNNSWNPGIQ